MFALHSVKIVHGRAIVRQSQVVMTRFPDVLRADLAVETGGNAECAILAAGADGRIWLEEYDSEGEPAAQMLLGADGQMLQVSRAQAGAELRPLLIAADALRPPPVRQAARLAFRSARLRGLRQEDRIAEVALPLSLADRMALAPRLQAAAPQVLGVVESVVLAEAALGDGWWLVCRRLRIALALPAARLDADGLPVDYDSHVIWTAPVLDRLDDPEIGVGAWWPVLDGVALSRPVDCMRAGGWLWVAEAGAGTAPARMLRWRVLSHSTSPG